MFATRESGELHRAYNWPEPLQVSTVTFHLSRPSRPGRMLDFRYAQAC